MKKLPQYIRPFSKSISSKRNLFFENLSYNRGLIQVSGDGIYEFLQGLITNDISHLKSNNANNAIFTMFLNKQGRVLFDTILYKLENTNTSCFIECDRAIENQLRQHLIFFRVRKKINIDIVTDVFNIWACFSDDDRHQSTAIKPLPAEKNISYEHIYACLDPRLNKLGMRLITPQNLQFKDIQHVDENAAHLLSNETYNYKTHRYANGVCEGTLEIPSSKCFPFEANCDYLHGISFHKGCYLGQEFTARTYHTGVIRKRIMPIIIHSHSEPKIEYDTEIVNECDQLVGRLKGIQNRYAIGLLKIDLALNSKYLKIGNIFASTYRPAWWPNSKSQIN